MSTQHRMLAEASDLVVGYGRTGILPKLSFGLWPSQVTSIIGHNGSGKSTLLKTLLGLIRPVSGQITFSKEVRIGYVPQREAIDPIYPIRVEHLVQTGTYSRLGVGRMLSKQDHERVWSCMEATRIMPLADRLFRTLSGGEQQRALLARALAGEPNLLVLDEPTASMDQAGAEAAMALTLELAKKRNAAILMVNHFLEIVAKVSDQVILLDRDHQEARVGHPSHLITARNPL